MNSTVHLYTGFILHANVQKKVVQSKESLSHIATLKSANQIRWLQLGTSHCLLLDFITDILFITNQSPEFSTLFPQQTLIGWAILWQLKIGRKFLTYKKYWEMQEYLYISVYEAMWKGQTLEVSPFSLFVSLHFFLDEKQTLKSSQIFLPPSEKTLKSRKTGVVKLWGLTWYVWELLRSESWLAVCILADKAVHCRTVNDEGVAGLTQETLQEPGRQKTTTSRAGK